MFDLNLLPESASVERLDPLTYSASPLHDGGIPAPGIVHCFIDSLAISDVEREFSVPQPVPADKSDELLSESRESGVEMVLDPPSEEKDEKFTSELLPITIRPQHLDPSHEARTSSCGTGERTDPLNGKRKNRYEHDARSSWNHDALPQDLLDEDHVKQYLHNGTHTRMFESLKDNGESSEASAARLALGNVLDTPSYNSNRPQNLLSWPRTPGPYALTLGRAAYNAFTSKRITNTSPFWRGKLHTEGPLFTRVVAYCLGDMKPDSRLKKLPQILSSRKHVKMEEFQEILRHGVAEPFTQIKPSLDASFEEVQRFDLTVEAMSGRSRLMQTPYILDVELGQQGFPANTALGSSADGSTDIKLYLMAPSSFHTVLKNCPPRKFISDLESMDAHEHGSLYGIFCSCSSNISLGILSLSQTAKQDVEIRDTVQNGSPASPSGSCTYKEMAKDNARNSSVLHMGLSNADRSLSKTTALEPIEVLNGVDAVDSRADLDKGIKESRTLECNFWPTHKRKREEDVEEEHSKRSYHGDEVLEEDALGSIQRQEWYNGRLMDVDRWNHSRENRNLGKNRIKVQQEDFFLERQDDLHREKLWDQGISSYKERERSSKDGTSGEQNMRLETEKGLSGPKSTGPSYTDEMGMGKHNRETKREYGKESHMYLKYLGEPKPTAQQDSDQAGKGSQCSNPKSYLAWETESGGLIQPSLDAQVGVRETAKFPTICGGNFEGKMSFKDVLTETSMLACETEGVGSMKARSETLKMPAENFRDLADGVPSKLDESLADFPLAKVEKERVCSEFHLDGFDRETRTWLTSKQNALYLQEEYGVTATIKAEIPNSNFDSKAESEKGSLEVKISMPVSETCEAAEAKWFVDQAADVVKAIASRGVFVKCLWYDGPVQVQPGDGTPSVPAVVKKIKGDDGKNLERVQDVTGVMIGVVLRKGAGSTPRELKSMPGFIGLRLKCIRRKGLLEASKQMEALLVYVADHFSKEVAANIADLHCTELISNAESPSSHSVSTKDISVSTKDISVSTKDIANSTVKLEGQLDHGYLNSVKLVDQPTPQAHMEDSDAKEEPEAGFCTELRETSSRPLYVSNLPENVTPKKIKNIFESILKENIDSPVGLDKSKDVVLDVRYIPEKFCAFVELANDDILNASLKLYGEDKTVFRGLKVELGLAASPKTMRQSAKEHGTRVHNTDRNLDRARGSFVLSAGNKEEELGGRHYAGSSTESDAEFVHDPWSGENGASRSDPISDKPKPLFLTELMRSASALSIKHLFEDIITEYISPSLVSSSGRQLVLDVRHVPSRGCAFVDLATPELVDFMLGLHSRRPDVFFNMKMELGRRPVPYSIEGNADRRLNVYSCDAIQAKSQNYGTVSGAQHYRYRSLSSGSRRKSARRLDVTYYEYDFIDACDEFTRQTTCIRKQKSDPEKTLYADRLPENASEGVIRRIFERVLFQHMTQIQLDVLGDQIISEVRYIPVKYCAFIVFATEDITRLALHLYDQDEHIFEKMRLKPHFHSRMEDLYREGLQEQDDNVHFGFVRNMSLDLGIDDYQKSQQTEPYDAHSRLSVHRAIAATAFKEVDRKRSVYVDKIPENISEVSMREIFEKAFQQKRHGCMVSQVTFFRDKFDPNKLCAFVEVRNENATKELIDCYNANEDAFRGMRVRPALKYHK